MAEYINEQPPIDRLALHIPRILKRVIGGAADSIEPEAAQSVELTSVLVGEKLMDVIQTTAPRGSRAGDLEKAIVAAEAPLAVVSMGAHPAYRGRTLYWVADRLGGGELRRTVMVRGSSVYAGGGEELRLMSIENQAPLAALFGSYDPDSMTTPGVLTCDAVVRIAQLPSSDGRFIMAQMFDPTLRGLHADAGIELSAVMQELSENKRR